MSGEHLQLGERGERLAEQYLRQCGYKILSRDFRCPIGQLDLVCLHQGQVVFVEVKTRTGQSAEPEQAVDHAKQRKLRQLARFFIHQKRLEDHPCRFDVVAVRWLPDGPAVEHFPDAFS